MKEKWIRGYMGLYSVSEDGQVRSHDRLDTKGRKIRGRIMKPYVNEQGYHTVGLRNGSSTKHLKVHRLVASAFIDNPEGKPEVNHIDEDKSNNDVSNLEWMTSQENCEYSTAKVYSFVSTAGMVTDIFNLKKFCRENNLDSACMYRVDSGEHLSHKGWKKA